MSSTWRSDEPPPRRRIGAAGWLRAGLRGACLSVVVYGSLVVFLLVRLVERPLCGVNRPVTPWITQFVCRGALRIIGLPLRAVGRPMTARGPIVANHCSWLDIFAINACARVYFVAKSEVAGWGGIGWLARATGTVFINRAGREARDQTALLKGRLRAGHRLVLFPEGTSTDGQRVLPFKTALFEALFHDDLALWVQPVSVVYHAPEGVDPRFYGWWGDMDFGPHLLQVLAASRQGCAEIVFHDPVAVSEFEGRKALSARCEADVRAGVEAGLGMR